MPDRVLFIDAGTWFGGAQNSLLTLLTQLQADGQFQPILASADLGQQGLAARSEAAGIATWHLRLHHWRRTALGAAQLVCDCLQARPVLQAAIRQTTPCLVHVNGTRSLPLLFGTVPTALPLVVHGRDLHESNLLRRYAQARHAHVIATSGPVAAGWQQTVPADKLQVIANGLAAPTAARLCRPQHWPWPVDRVFTIVLVADFTPWKSHARFLHAVAQAAAQAPELRAIVIGRAPNRQALRYLNNITRLCQRLNLSDIVRFRTDLDDALPWIAAADLLVSAATDEPFGRTVIEALYCGVPVVAVDSGGPAEILRGCAAATLVAPAPEAIAAAVLQWRPRQARQAVAAIATAHASQFSPGAMTAQITALYQQLLGTPQPG